MAQKQKILQRGAMWVMGMTCNIVSRTGTSQIYMEPSAVTIWGAF